LGTIGAAVVVAVVLLLVLPRLSVTASNPVNLNDPITASFTVSNKSFIPLRHVGALVSIEQMDPNQIIAHDNLPGEWLDHSLDQGDQFTIMPSAVFRFKNPKEATIGVVVSYKSWIIPWEQKQVFSFSIRPQANGNLYWAAR
jgi:hypothetical protein